MAGGRPLKFQSVEELQQKIDAFFLECDKKQDPYTITGLALALDTTRQGLINYEDREEFYDTIKIAKARVENFAEKRLYSGTAAGPIFALKNFDWTDKQDVNLGGQKNNPIQTEMKPEDRAILDRFLQQNRSQNEKE
jgi:hypothetical protein